MDNTILRYLLEFVFPKFSFGTIGFRIGDGIRCLEPEAQNSVLSLEVAKIQFSNEVLWALKYQTKA